jgi:hypothetical protein
MRKAVTIKFVVAEGKTLMWHIAAIAKYRCCGAAYLDKEARKRGIFR